MSRRGVAGQCQRVMRPRTALADRRWSGARTVARRPARGRGKRTGPAAV